MELFFKINLIMFPYALGAFGYMCLRSGLYWMAFAMFFISFLAWVLTVTEFSKFRSDKAYLKSLEHFDGLAKSEKRTSSLRFTKNEK